MARQGAMMAPGNRALVCVLLVTLTFPALIHCASSGTGPRKQPNILIILADDLGWGDVSFHGSKQVPTPNIDLLASTGVILNNYYVSPICSPSRSALLTGYHPIKTGMQQNVLGPDMPYGLPLNFSTLGDRFHALGYGTHLVGKWHVGFYTWDHMPTRRGFDTHFGYLTGMGDYYNRIYSPKKVGYDFRENEGHANISKYQGQYSTDMFTDRVVELLQGHEKNSSKPFMIYFAEQSVHTGNFETIQPPARYKDKFTWIANHKRRNYAGVIAALDESVGRVFKALNETGHLEDTIIFFSTDNGGASGNEHGQFIDGSMASNHPLKGSKYTLWEGGVRGTSFLWSSHLTRPHVSNQLMHITDVLPTLYSAAGGNVAHLGPIDGLNLWPALVNQTESPHVRQHLLHNIDHTWKYWAVRQHNYKLTSGTHREGHFDTWHTVAGQLKEDGHICYECSDVYKVLKGRTPESPPKPVHVHVDCKAEHHTHRTACHSLGQHNDRDFCLFDLHADPCEMNNIAATHPAVVKRLYNLYLSYNASYAKPENKPIDPKGDPAHHGGWWGPWM